MTSAHSHIKRPNGAEQGSTGLCRAGWNPSAGVWVLQGAPSAVTRTNPGALHHDGCHSQISDAQGCFKRGLFRAIPRTRDSMSVTCKHCCYPLSS